jgi:hypothetical protein
MAKSKKLMGESKIIKNIVAKAKHVFSLMKKYPYLSMLPIAAFVLVAFLWLMSWLTGGALKANF